MSSDFTDPPKGVTRVDDDAWRDARERPVPPDLLDEIEGPDDFLRPEVATDDPLTDVRPDGGLDRPLPERQRRHAAVTAQQARQVTRDTSLSRDADMQAAGGDVLAVHGMSDPSEIGHPGPLGPDASDQPADAEGEPAGQWGSSGAPTN
jgi:hypothetical protein